MKKLLHYAILFALLGIILSSNSCTPETCFDKTESFLGVTFYSYSTKKISTPDSLSVWGVGHESVKIYSKVLKLQKAELPLNPAATNCGYIIRINGINDTLDLTYSSYPHLVSKECGYSFYYNLEGKGFTRHIIDSVHIIRTNLTTINEENIRIYY